MNKKRGDGSTESEHRESAERQMAMFGLRRRKLGTVEVQPEPELPKELEYLWLWFHELTLGIEIPAMSAPVVTWESLYAWCNIMNITLTPWEARALVDIGQVRLMVMLEKPKGQIVR